MRVAREESAVGSEDGQFNLAWNLESHRRQARFHFSTPQQPLNGHSQFTA